MEEIEKRFPMSNDIWQQEGEIDKNKNCFERIANQIRITIHRGLKNLNEDLEKICKESNSRKEWLQNVKQNIYAVHTCCRLLDWIQRR